MEEGLVVVVVVKEGWRVVVVGATVSQETGGGTGTTMEGGVGS